MELGEPLVLFERFQLELTSEGKTDRFRCRCPFHDDQHPSCLVYLETQTFKCQACSAHGDLVALLSKHAKVSRTALLRLVGALTPSDKPVVDPAMVEGWHHALLRDKELLKVLFQRKGLTLATVKQYGLGKNNQRVTIPIYNGMGEVVNVRQWSPTSKTHKVIGLPEHESLSLYPFAALGGQHVVLVEGELKALLLQQSGVNGLSSTGGAKSWRDDWSSYFIDKEVYLVYDIDVAGRHGARAVARQLRSVARALHLVELPLDPKVYPTGGVDELLLREKWTAAQFAELLTATPAWEPGAESGDEDTRVYPVTLAESSESRYYQKFIRCEVVVSAKDTAPYLLPKTFMVKCARDQEMCLACRVPDLDTVTVGDRDPLILEMVNKTRDNLNPVLKRAARVPRTCGACKMEVLESRNIEELRLIPQLQLNASHGIHVVRRAFYVGHGLDCNTGYTIEARAVPEPNTQYATLLIYSALPAEDSLATFVLREPTRLAVFQPAQWDEASLQTKLNDIHQDLSSNITRIYERPYLHLAYDLIYHTPLTFKFQGQVVKGWGEGLVLGDSGQGKSEAISRLIEHYGLGEKVDSKGASVAGLLGGLQETGKRWFVTWGVIPLNDRRLVVLEEVKGMSPETIAKLTDMRSSGVAELSKIERTKTHARTRLIWISNARSDRSLLSYNYGVDAVRELVGSLEDIRRFDLVVTVATGEVSQKVLNMRDRERPRCEHVYTQELCHDLILWAWSRREDQVCFTEAATNEVLRAAHDMSQRYVSQIPLVEPADQRLKLARLAAALAARTFSTQDHETLLVLPCHIKLVETFLDAVYNSPSLGYRDYSKMLQGELELRDPKEVEAALKRMPYARDLVRQFLDTAGFNIFDLADWTELDREECRGFISTLVRKNAVKRGQGVYVKTPAFIGLLKRLDLEGDLTNASLAELAGDEI